MLIINESDYNNAFVSLEIPDMNKIIGNYEMTTEMLLIILNDVRVRNMLNSMVRHLVETNYQNMEFIENCVSTILQIEAYSRFRYGAVLN